MCKTKKGLCLENVKDGQMFIFGGVEFKRHHESEVDAQGSDGDKLIGCHVGKTDSVVYIMNHAWVEVEE